ncbi:MAG: exodeoxyribonuclease III [Defluviitaleaceae bacterium]|nr:exodeoxyribonuclease III [Defluviitaleaceae bacterium]
MKIISWNVNGLRSCVKKGFLDFYGNDEYDVICLQEIKMMSEQADFSLAGRNEFWNSAQRKGYSGTAVFSRQEPLTARYGIGIEEHDTEGRVVTLEYEKFFLVNCYTPNSKHELLRLAYRMEWEDAFAGYLKALERDKPVVLVGDLNVAHKEIDLANPKSNTKNPGFTPQEREKMTALLGRGFVDTFRHFYPERKDAYTWWSPMSNSRERNVGWRIDYVIVSEAIIGNVADSFILSDVYGSDHCPVGIEINVQ